MVSCATALRPGAAEAEQVLRHSTRDGPRHPTQAALAELARTARTVFPCDYLASALQVLEYGNSASTALLWCNVNKHGSIRMDLDKQIEWGLAAVVPVPAPGRTPQGVRGQDTMKGLAAGLTDRRMNETVWRTLDFAALGFEVLLWPVDGRCGQASLVLAGVASLSMARVSTLPEMPQPPSVTSSIRTMVLVRARSP